MSLLAASAFARRISTVKTHGALRDALADTCDRMGIRYFALSHHVDFCASPRAVRIHNYPPGWQDWYDANRLGLSDPIHRASHRTAQGFLWRDVPQLIPLTRTDRDVLARGREIGLGEGVTIPAHVPGEALGSCTFVSVADEALPDEVLPWAQMIGLFAFEGARRLFRQRRRTPGVRVSDRQRECIALAGRGLRNHEIARELGIGEQTVLEHMREARARLGVHSRTELVVRLIADGALCIDDVLKPERMAL
nr:LuxR family transcriptional regulator [Sphingosinicella soli]